MKFNIEVSDRVDAALLHNTLLLLLESTGSALTVTLCIETNTNPESFPEVDSTTSHTDPGNIADNTGPSTSSNETADS